MTLAPTPFNRTHLTGLWSCAVVLAGTLSCGTSTNVKQHEGEVPTAMDGDAPRAQVVLKTQDFAFDPARKDSIGGAYVHRTRVVVPPDLSPQNKWVMFEGPVLENDKIAYRFYLDSRHRFDIYGKRVPDLVMDTVGWDYHDVRDWGADILKVGESLGFGSPGILYRDSVYTFSNADQVTVEVTDTGGAAAALSTTFAGLTVGAQQLTVREEWRLGAGRYDGEVSLAVTEGVLPEGASFTTGLNKLGTDVHILSGDSRTAVYTYGPQSFHHEDLGMAVVADHAYGPRSVDARLSHLLTFAPDRPEVTYRMLAAWSRGVGSIDTREKFEGLIRNVLSE